MDKMETLSVQLPRKKRFLGTLELYPSAPRAVQMRGLLYCHHTPTAGGKSRTY
jgi:hypothetical protein